MSDDEQALRKLLLKRGLLLPDEFAEAEAAQKESGRPLMEVLAAMKFLTTAQIEDAKAALRKQVRFCRQCQVPVRVPRIMPQGERCPRCLGPVQWQEEAVAARMQDVEGLVRLAHEELPAAVSEARRDPQNLFGKYILTAQVGRGGAGVVHKAWDTMLGEFVALKFIREPERAEAATSAAERVRRERIVDFLQEARVALRLRHPHIVPVRDIARVEERFYIVMDYVEGQTLAEHIRASRLRKAISPLFEEPALFLGFVRDVADAMHYAHGFSPPVVHCDLKPANVLVSMTHVAYVMDFGLARLAGEGEEGEAKIRGTPAYMAPEQLSSRPGVIGPWTDVYGLGAILYELLTGQAVYTGTTMEVIRKVMRGGPERPTARISKGGSTQEVQGELSRLEEICLKCLAHEPERRYAEARQVGDELEAICRQLEAGQGADLVPESVRVAQTQIGFRRVDEDLTQMRFDEAILRLGRIEESRGDTRMRRKVDDRRRYVVLFERVRDRLCERLNERRPEIRNFALLHAELPVVEVLKATIRRLLLLVNDEPREVPWSDVAPDQFASMAGAMGLTDPEDCLALGLFCRQAHLPTRAERYLALLTGTPLEAEAKDLLGPRS